MRTYNHDRKIAEAAFIGKKNQKEKENHAYLVQVCDHVM